LEIPESLLLSQSGATDQSGEEKSGNQEEGEDDDDEDWDLEIPAMPPSTNGPLLIKRIETSTKGLYLIGLSTPTPAREEDKNT